jgi:hypothetical protein
VSNAEVVGDAVRLLVAGIRTCGFRGRAPRLSRRLASGTVQTVYVVRQMPFRPPSFSIGLSVIPGALMEGWRAVAPNVLATYEKSRSPAGGLGYTQDLNHADGHHEPSWHAPATQAEAERVAANVVDQFARAGLPWLERWSDASAVVGQAGDLEANPLDLGYVRVLAASLLEVLPSSSPQVMKVMDQTLFLLNFWQKQVDGLA